MEIQAKVEEKISDVVILSWIKSNIKTNYKLEVFLDIYKKMFEKFNVNWVCGIIYAAKISNNFSSEYMNNHNPFGVMDSIGDKGEELVHYASLGYGLVDGIKRKILKLPSWPNDIVEKYNDILKSIGSDPIAIPVNLPPAPPSNPVSKAEPIKEPVKTEPNSKVPVKKKSSFLKSFIFFLTGVTIVLGMLSFFIPVLAPIAAIIKGILGLINVFYGGN